MQTYHDPATGDAKPRWEALTGPWVVLALCWIIGVWLGTTTSHGTAWLVIAVVCWVPGVVMVTRQRLKAAGHWGLISVVAIGAAWAAIRHDSVHGGDIILYAGAQAQLVELTGVVDTPTRLRTHQRGEFGRFTYRAPATRFVLHVETILVDGVEQLASGRVLVTINKADHRVQVGDRIGAIGWLKRVQGPSNPGEHDFRLSMHRRGIDTRMNLSSRGNWHLINRASWSGSWLRWRSWVSDAAVASLGQGMRQGSERVAFLDALLLGQRRVELGDVQTSFRRVGLAHLLSISGAHLGILLGLVWLVVRVWVQYPPRAALCVLLVLALYLLAVPLRVPIIRAGIMAGVFCLTYATGRQMSAIQTLAGAAIVILIWRPGDLFDPGFQLSFGTVAAILAFTWPLNQRLWPDWLLSPDDRIHHKVYRWLTGYLAVNIVAFLVTLPIVGYHFQLVSPFAVVVSIVALPVITVVMALGYLKIVLGMMLPSTGMVLAWPLAGVSDVMTGVVGTVSSWPGAAIELPAQPPIAWCLGTLAVVIAWLAGGFVRRRVALATSVAVCLIWIIVAVHPRTYTTMRTLVGQAPPASPESPALRLNMLAVGDGSCYLMRFASSQAVIGQGVEGDNRQTSGASGEHVVMFDCGSQDYLDVGTVTIVPVLHHLGVRRIDTLFLSHADLDHFSGSLAVIDQVGVERVLMSPQMLEQADREPQGATGYLVNSLRQRGIPFEAVSQGWRQKLGQIADLELLWPPADLHPKTANDSSLVLSIRVGSQRVLLNGDIQQQAITSLLARGIDLHADVVDLPHHGSMVKASTHWLKQVSPSVVLQSTGQKRLQFDKWAGVFDGLPINRLITAKTGMVWVTINRDGRIEHRTFQSP